MPSNPRPESTACAHCGATSTALFQCGLAAGAPVLRCVDEARCIRNWLPAEHPEHAQRIAAALTGAAAMR
jgi:hypothetical protein